MRETRPANNRITGPAKVVVREARDLQYGDRILHFGNRAWAEILTVLEPVPFPDGSDYVTVAYVSDNGAFSWRFSSWNLHRFAALTHGTCDNPHKGYSLCCNPAPLRLDGNPWPGDSMVCPDHRAQMHAAHRARLLTVPPAIIAP